MAATAETIETFEYAHSSSGVLAIGAIMVNHEVELKLTPERNRVLADYVSGIREMIATDEEFQEVLDIDDERGHPIVDGLARDIDGTAIIDMVMRGERNSAARASIEPEFEIENIRDGGDVITQKIADNLKDGESYTTASMYTKEGLKNHPKIYINYLGYREYLVNIQRFSRVGNVLEAGVSTLFVKNPEALQKVLAANGMIIPPNESNDTWIRHGHKTEATPEQAKDMVQDIRDQYYEEVGMTEERYSVSDYVENSSQIVEGFFDTYYPSLAHALYTECNNETLQSLAQTMLQTDLTKMKAEVRSNLIRAASSESFDHELYKTMDSIIRYAVVEELRKGLKALITKIQPEESLLEWPSSTPYRSTTIPGIDINYTNKLMARNVSSGMRKGRTYGGCAGQVELNEGEDPSGNSTSELPSSYDYSGKMRGSGREKWKLKKGKCEVKSCPTRPGEVKLGPCGVCMDRCQKLFDAGKDPTKQASTTTRKITTYTPQDFKPKMEATNTKTSEKKVSYSYN